MSLITKLNTMIVVACLILRFLIKLRFPQNWEQAVHGKRNPFEKLKDQIQEYPGVRVCERKQGQEQCVRVKQGTYEKLNRNCKWQNNRRDEDKGTCEFVQTKDLQKNRNKCKCTMKSN